MNTNQMKKISFMRNKLASFLDNLTFVNQQFDLREGLTFAS